MNIKAELCALVLSPNQRYVSFFTVALIGLLLGPCTRPGQLAKCDEYAAEIFSRGHATLQPALSVHRSVGQSVGRLVTFKFFYDSLSQASISSVSPHPHLPSSLSE